MVLHWVAMSDEDRSADRQTPPPRVTSFNAMVAVPKPSLSSLSQSGHPAPALPEVTMASFGGYGWGYLAPFETKITTGVVETVAEDSLPKDACQVTVSVKREVNDCSSKTFEHV